MIVVAAVGNDGPSARPLYPAAFEPVVAVTAVDRRKNIYRWANQGPQVDFAAWGVSTPVALAKGGYGEESGTSFAAPIVAAAIARADGRRRRICIRRRSGRSSPRPKISAARGATTPMAMAW